MNGRDEDVRRIVSKYRRVRRKGRQERLKKRLPFWITAGVLLIVSVVLTWVLTQPTPPALAEGALRICILDVGQGDAILLQTPHNAVLIDGGEAEQGYRVLHMLKAMQVQKLDAVINSHPHADHIGGLQIVLAHMPAEKLYLADIPEQLLPTAGSYLHVLETAQERGIPVEIPQCHDTFSFGDAVLEFLCTDNTAFDDLNNCSLGCRVTCGGISMFLAGDLEQKGEDAFLADGLVQPAQILKVSHHGSNSSSSAAFLSALKPEYAAISCAPLNDYGHPAQKCLERLTKAECSIYRTDIDGTVIFTVDGNDVHAVTHFDFGF